jgi:hypothetical protein
MNPPAKLAKPDPPPEQPPQVPRGEWEQMPIAERVRLVHELAARAGPAPAVTDPPPFAPGHDTTREMALAEPDPPPAAAAATDQTAFDSLANDRWRRGWQDFLKRLPPPRLPQDADGVEARAEDAVRQLLDPVRQAAALGDARRELRRLRKLRDEIRRAATAADATLQEARGVYDRVLAGGDDGPALEQAHARLLLAQEAARAKGKWLSDFNEDPRHAAAVAAARDDLESRLLAAAAAGGEESSARAGRLLKEAADALLPLLLAVRQEEALRVRLTREALRTRFREELEHLP